jgi:alkylation response protein AidB-like acyl-CoA dehydrogenase
MLAWWRVALAAEAVGCMEMAIETTVRYACEREMFGTKLGSFQAVRHRLGECHVHAQAAKWLTREAAWSRADPARAAAAAAYAADVAKAVLDDCHQFHGAIGLTREHPLHLWTLRLQALRAELGGARRHERDLATAAWP